MDPASILVKTPKGVEEVEAPRHNLESRLRSILIVVNGKLTAGELSSRFGQLGDISAMLEELAKQGFIQPAGDRAEKLGRARSELARVIADRLGPMGDEMAAKIEKAATIEELRAYLEARRAVLNEALGKQGTAAFWAKAASLLG